MGDMADYLNEQGLDTLMAHNRGECLDVWCQYCHEEWEDDRKGEK